MLMLVDRYWSWWAGFGAGVGNWCTGIGAGGQLVCGYWSWWATGGQVLVLVGTAGQVLELVGN